MNRYVGIMLGLLLAGLIAACGGSDSAGTPSPPAGSVTPVPNSSPSPPGTSTAVAETPSSGSLIGALLKASDLPEGFAPATLSGGGLGPCGLPLETGAVVEQGGIEFNKMNPRLRVEEVVRYFAPGGAEAYMADVNRATTQCKDSLVHQPPKVLSNFDLPAMGDESVALWLSADDVPVQIYLVFVRHGDYVWQMSQSALGYRGVNEEQSAIARTIAGRADERVSVLTASP
jgi:hypothetical protein